MTKTKDSLKRDIEESTTRLRELEAVRTALPAEHPNDARAALQRQLTAEQQLLERLHEIQRMSGNSISILTRTRVLLTVAALLSAVVFALFTIKV